VDSIFGTTGGSRAKNDSFSSGPFIFGDLRRHLGYLQTGKLRELLHVGLYPGRLISGMVPEWIQIVQLPQLHSIITSARHKTQIIRRPLHINNRRLMPRIPQTLRTLTSKELEYSHVILLRNREKMPSVREPHQAAIIDWHFVLNDEHPLTDCVIDEVSMCRSD